MQCLRPHVRLLFVRIHVCTQGRLDALGNERDAEALFKSHAHDLMDRARAGLKALLTERLGPLIPGACASACVHRKGILTSPLCSPHCAADPLPG
jgi:hypothetical protein